MGPIWRLLDGEHYVNSNWVLAEDDSGDIRVPSILGRIKHGEPWWAARYDARKPWHWPFALWTLVRRGLAFVESRDA